MQIKREKVSTAEIAFSVCLALGFFGCPSSTEARAGDAVPRRDAQDNQNSHNNNNNQEKLLVINLGGFRWDYYDKHKKSLNAFQHLLQEGVQVEWVRPIFPAMSYPSWTTISTGVFPETHGIIGNYMFDLNVTDSNQAVFDLFDHNTTAKLHWWQNAEPIWTTATRYGKKVFLRFWSRCDVPVNEVKPFECTGFRDSRGIDNVRNSFSIAVQKLKQDFDLAMVYVEHLDSIGHKHGPNSPELKQALIDIDHELNELLDQLIDSQLEEKVNIIVLSDYGMTWTGEGSGVRYINLDEFVERTEINRSLDKGAVLAIAPFAKHFQTVYNRLKVVNGIDVYMREDIPEEYHYKNGRLVQDILVVAKEKFLVRGLQNSRQIPRERDPNIVWTGQHGYPPNVVDMRSAFFAKGPAFKKGIIHKPIHLEDIYQIFVRVLDIPGQPHNGSWSRVSGMLVNGAVPVTNGNSLPILCTLALTFVASQLILSSSH